MDHNHMVQKERELAIDLESGGTTSEEDGIKDPISGVKQAKKLLGKVWSGFVSFDGSVKGEDGLNMNNSLNAAENTQLLIDEKPGREEVLGFVEKKAEKEKKDRRKSTSAKKAPKPPRPPRGPSLDAADHKLIREISELAMLKRARVERMKAQRKMKAAKTASSNSNLCAMVITVVFCLVILFQGMSSRGNSRLSFQGSPQSAVEMKGRLISVQYYKNLPANGTDGPAGTRSPSFVEQVSGSAPYEEGSRVAG